MPTVNSDLVPTITPGTLFSRLSTDSELSIRWLVALEPVYYQVLNRPMADLSFRQLILAKSIDTLNTRLGHQALFPFIEQPQIVDGTTTVDVPLLMWDMHVSVPKKWELIRLINVKRISGTNDTSPDGSIRFSFAGRESGSVTDVAMFYADYDIGSTSTYQIIRISKFTATSSTEPVIVDSGELETIDGFIIFVTKATDDIEDFLDVVISSGSADTDGVYTSPSVYEVKETTTLDHGTGLLTSSAVNFIPDINSDVNTWINSFNYPFADGADRTSADNTSIVLPSGLFKEFNIIAPSSDKPTDDTSGNYYPVYLSRVLRNDNSSDSLTFYFSTYNVESASVVPIEFGSLTLTRDLEHNTLVSIEPENHLFPTYSTNDEFHQGFGRGHVVLSSLWGSSSEIGDFFDLFASITNDPAEVVFTEESGRISSYAVSRVPKFAPTSGQFEALKGSKDGVSSPSSTNRFVVEEDQGRGTQIDFSSHTSLSASKRNNTDISRYGYTGSLLSRVIELVVNDDGEDHSYETDVLPRLKILFGRDLKWGDRWFDGVRLKFYNGESWIG